MDVPGEELHSLCEVVEGDVTSQMVHKVGQDTVRQ